ncbi:MAG: D-hexose-6-phosphate mutarotase [gamma proteobacterium symbiont of Lucinoma myriamae]|nr:D-hexose-6-phosphate mutarotase [gamma proteobacterium symbiont of Lucinoma myriamae]
MCDSKTLNEKFSIPGLLEFVDNEQGALVARMETSQGTMEIARQGAQLLFWTPKDQAPVVWLSPQAQFKSGKSLRGGSPVCWPWFGPHPENTSLPGHGFARNFEWRILETSRLRDATRIIMIFEPGEEQLKDWPHQAELTLSITMGEGLDMVLTTRNQGKTAFTITQALHTYFNVGDIARVRVEGLEGKEYIDKVDGETCHQQEGAITIDREVDRIYLNCPEDLVIVDEILKRRVRITRQGSNSAVVWNPWAEKGAAFGDMGEEGYRNMLCVETTNVAKDTVTLKPGESFTQISRYTVEPF